MGEFRENTERNAEDLVPTPRKASMPLAVGLFAAAMLLWWFTDWAWWILLPLVIGSLVVRMVMPLFFAPWAHWGGHLVLAGVILYLATMTTTAAVVMAIGLVVLAGAWSLRKASPTWMRWVALALGLVMLFGGGLAQAVSTADGRARQEAAEQRDREYRIADMRPDTPGEALSRLVTSISYDDPFWACWLFDKQGSRQFAEVVGAATCEAAVHTLHDQIQPGRTGLYGGAKVSPDDIQQSDDRTRLWLDACHMYVIDHFDYVKPPGPQLGQLTLQLEPQFKAGYLVTGYTRCGQGVPGRPAPTSTTPATLPTYAPSFAGLMTTAIADHDDDVCELFTPAGSDQFAQAVGVKDCAAALAQLADQVQDPSIYAQPSNSASTTETTDGRPVVDACHLTWDRFNSGAAPGPQVGYLTLAQPEPGTPGYLIDGYRPC
jgi:hypothetical protein